MKVLVCKDCGNTERPRNTALRCSKCGGTLKPYKEEKKEPIAVETIFETKAKDTNIKVNEKIL